MDQPAPQEQPQPPSNVNGVTPPRKLIRKHGPGGNRGLEQAYKLRDYAAAQALELQAFVPKTFTEAAHLAKAVKDLAAVWVDASERIRILRGRPLPGSLKPKGPAKRKASPLTSGTLFLDPQANSDAPRPEPMPAPLPADIACHPSEPS